MLLSWSLELLEFQHNLTLPKPCKMSPFLYLDSLLQRQYARRQSSALCIKQEFQRCSFLTVWSANIPTGHPIHLKELWLPIFEWCCWNRIDECSISLSSSFVAMQAIAVLVDFFSVPTIEMTHSEYFATFSVMHSYPVYWMVYLFFFFGIGIASANLIAYHTGTQTQSKWEICSGWYIWPWIK